MSDHDDTDVRHAKAVEQERAAAVRDALSQVRGSLGRSTAPRHW